MTGDLERVESLHESVRDSQTISKAVVAVSFLTIRCQAARHNEDNEQDTHAKPEEGNAIQNEEGRTSEVVIRCIILC